MRDALHLCREHGQWPDSWDRLDRGMRALLLADLDLRVAEGKR